jgi:uncharacterized membrane protein YgdD (TMEM256/DUF423 family)
MTASRIHIAVAAGMGATGVVLWSLAAHGAHSATLATAAQMLLLHACAVLGLTACRKQGLVHDRTASIGTTALILGVVLFSSDLALRSFTGLRLFPGAAPLGGGLMILGWLIAAVAALIRPRA